MTGTVIPRMPTSGRWALGTVSARNAGETRHHDTKDAKMVGRLAPGSVSAGNAEDGMCPGVTAGLVHHQRKLGSAQAHLRAGRSRDTGFLWRDLDWVHC